jgi:ATP-dependent DNA helicase DinG
VSEGNDYLADVFGPVGMFADRFPGYETRPGQVALARMIDHGMENGRHVLGEGPCGTGKGFMYGVPAVWHAHHRGKRVVIVTANIALQEQLVRKDLPMLRDVLPWPFTFALLKGRNNFVCHQRVADAQAQGELRGLLDEHQRHQADDVLAWVKETTTGDVSELPFVPAPGVWSRFAVSSDECLGASCPYRATCFSERAIAAAHEANLIVTNYHLLFAHLAVRQQTDEDLVLPAFDMLVLDEAHEAADIARDCFGFSVSEFAVRRLARAADLLGHRELGDVLRAEARQLFEALGRYARSPRYQSRLTAPGFASGSDLVSALVTLTRLAANTAADEEADVNLRTKARAARRQADALGSRLAEALRVADPGKVYFIELDAKGRAKLGAKWLDVADLLRDELFARTSSVTLVSATLTTGGTFDFVRRELGVAADALELVAESPFDFRRQALLVIPDGIPEPRDPRFADAVAGAMQQVIDACDGRVLGLFTSYKIMNAVYEQIAGDIHRVFKQGDLPRTELARIFKEDVGSVLLGTESFWTGIDVPGEALTGVVIDKLPFPNVEDPVVNAICARDKGWFPNYFLPRAIIMLRQGVGRLIRSQSDIGVVVILDPRIADKPYGRKFLRSLPPMMSSRKLANISRFLQEAGAARSTSVREDGVPEPHV